MARPKRFYIAYGCRDLNVAASRQYLRRSGGLRDGQGVAFAGLGVLARPRTGGATNKAWDFPALARQTLFRGGVV